MRARRVSPHPSLAASLKVLKNQEFCFFRTADTLAGPLQHCSNQERVCYSSPWFLPLCAAPCPRFFNIKWSGSRCFFWLYLPAPTHRAVLKPFVWPARRPSLCSHFMRNGAMYPNRNRVPMGDGQPNGPVSQLQSIPGAVSMTLSGKSCGPNQFKPPRRVTQPLAGNR